MAPDVMFTRDPNDAPRFALDAASAAPWNVPAVGATVDRLAKLARAEDVTATLGVVDEPKKPALPDRSWNQVPCPPQAPFQ